MASDRPAIEPSRAAIDRLPGPVLLEFGASWCPHCQAIQAELASELTNFPQVRHIQVEDGKGQPLGRSFRVKWWPTLVFMKDGHVLRQVSRPPPGAIRAGLEQIAGNS